MRKGELDVEGGRLAWVEQGEGPPLVLLHGFSFDRSMWDAQLSGLAGSLRVVAYDLRGYGTSSRPAATYSHVDDLTAMFAGMELKAPVLVGLSLGANIALEWVDRYPGHARGMILASPGLPGHRWTRPRPPDAIRDEAIANGVASARERWCAHPIYATLRERPRALAALRAMVGHYDGWHWTHDDPRAPPPDLAERLPMIDTPALILSGAEDDPGYREIAARLASELVDGRLETFDGCGHLVNMEEPDRFNDAVTRYCGTI